MELPAGVAATSGVWYAPPQMLLHITLPLALLALFTGSTDLPTRAKGTFEVQLKPGLAQNGINHMTFDKQFHGDLEGTSSGEMLYAGSPTLGGYVALEVIDGRLGGRRGTFVLQHKAAAMADKQDMDITVVPGSGAGELIGLSGRLTITIKDKQHFYDFEYTLPHEQ